MDLKPAAAEAAHASALPPGLDHAELETDGPAAFGDRMGTPAPDETVLWKGRPNLALLARTAFHTHTAGLYMAALTLIALMTGNREAALVAGVLGVALVGILLLMAWLSARTTLYILTDARLILRIGMAIETRINIPLKQIEAAQLRTRGKGFGDIAVEIGGDRLLGYLLLWPHARAWHYAKPQPMLRAIPDAQGVARILAEARAPYGAIERGMLGAGEAPADAGHAPALAPAAAKAATSPRRAGSTLGERGLEGAPA